MAEEQQPVFVDDLTVHDLWVEATRVIAAPGPMIRIEFFVHGYPLEGANKPNTVRPVARIAMTVEQSRMLTLQIQERLEALQQMLALVQTPPHGSSN